MEEVDRERPNLHCVTSLGQLCIKTRSAPFIEQYKKSFQIRYETALMRFFNLHERHLLENVLLTSNGRYCSPLL